MFKFNKNLRRIVVEDSGLPNSALKMIADEIVMDFETQHADCWLHALVDDWTERYRFREVFTSRFFAHEITLPAKETDFWNPDEQVTLYMGDEHGIVTFSGSIAKRVSKFIHKAYKFKMSKSALAAIGNTTYLEKPTPVTFFYNYTQDFDWKRGEFNDPDSCFFTCRNYARRMLRDMGAWVCQLWKGSEVLPPKLRNARDRKVIKSAGTHEGIGRFYLLPIDGTSKLLAFNWYRPRTMPNWSLRDVMRIIRNDFPEAGCREVSLNFDDSDDGLIFVNNGEGLLIDLHGDIEDMSDLIRSPMVSNVSDSHDYISIDAYGWLDIPDGYGSVNCCGACGKDMSDSDEDTVTMLNELGIYLSGPTYRNRNYNICPDCYIHDRDLWTTQHPRDASKDAKIVPLTDVYELCS